jgi:hypothetical protein
VVRYSGKSNPSFDGYEKTKSTRKPENQETRKPRNQKTRKPELVPEVPVHISASSISRVAVSKSVAVSIAVAVSVEVSAAVPVAVTLEVLKRLIIIIAATRWCHYLQMLSEVCTHIFLNC